MKKLASLLLTIPLAWSLAHGQQVINQNKPKDPFENAKEIRIKSEYIRTFYKGIYDGGDYGSGLADYANEAKNDSIKAKEIIPDRIVSYYLLTKTGKDTIILDVNNLDYSPHYFHPGFYYKSDASQLISLKDSLHPKEVLSLVKALVNEKGDTLELIRKVKDWRYPKDPTKYSLEGVNKPSQIRRIK